MFGYVTPLKSELKFKEFEYFRSYYCGLCNEIKNQFGNIEGASLNLIEGGLQVIIDQKSVL